MTEKYSNSKLKSVLCYESDSENDDVDDDVDLGLSLFKLNLGPNKKLLVLCLGGLLVHRAHLKERHTVSGLRADIRYGNFLVFKRPFCTDFLNFCFQRFDVALWSSAREHNIEGVLSSITGGARNKFVFVWSQEECTDSGYGCLHKKQKPLFLKRMKDLWENKSYKEKYSASNTLLIDDEPHTALLNPPNTAIFPQPYKTHNVEDTFLGPNGDFRKFLDGLTDAKDVPSYVKDHPIGQPGITPSHPDWKYYKNIVLRFGKKSEEASSSADS